MDINVHYTLEFGENAMFVAMLALGLVVVWLLYTTSTPKLVLPPDPSKGRLGFRPN